MPNNSNAYDKVEAPTRRK